MTNEEAKTFLNNLKIFIEEHPIVADWLVEIAYRKTENSSEISNNCEELNAYRKCVESRSFWDNKHCDWCYFDERCPFDEPKDEPTISKMEQVEDEPQTEDFQDWKDQMWTEAVIESQKEREGEINRQDVLTYIDRVANSGMGKKKSLEYIRKYVEKADRKTEPQTEREGE